MNKKLLFATHNKNKVKEVSQVLTNFEILSLTDIGFYQEVEETGKTFHENAEIKVDAVRNEFNGTIFADDSGLVIPALNNEPGIYSSRYAGTGNSEDNIQKVLQKLENGNNRYAYFLTVICLLYNNKKYFFEGKIQGDILLTPEGSGGFGYDPIFKPKDYVKSFALLSFEEKNRISHRGKAIEMMKSFIFEQN